MKPPTCSHGYRLVDAETGEVNNPPCGCTVDNAHHAAVLPRQAPRAPGSAPNPVLTFGKHRRQPVSACPAGYLDWLIGQDWLTQPLKGQITAHLRTRSDWKRMGEED